MVHGQSTNEKLSLINCKELKMTTGKYKINYGYLIVSKCCLALQHIVTDSQTDRTEDRQNRRKQTDVGREIRFLPGTHIQTDRDW